MANLTETSTWETGIYQLETTDPVLGGVSGISNLQPKQLANRTQYLKAQIDALSAASANYVTAAYVQNELEKLDFKQSVRAATTANITLSGTQTIDGVSLNTGNRVLVKNQTDATQNGIYVVNGSAWTRAIDADESEDVTPGLTVVVEEGTLQADTIWKLTTNATITLGSTALTFVDITNGLAPLASPSFTGTPLAPTATPATSNTQIATTDFVTKATDGMVTVNVAGGADVTLTAAQYGLAILNLTGLLTNNINLIFPTGVTGQWVVHNNTTGSYNVTCKTAAGSGVVASQGYAVVVYDDGTNVYAASSAGQASLTQQTYSPAAGVTVLTIPGGYTPGALLLSKNGAFLTAGVDFTATNGSTVTLATATITSDTFTSYAFSTFNVANAVAKTGDTMSGALTLSGDPTSALHAAPKQYVDASNASAIFGIGASVASNALTLTAGTLNLDFRSGTLSSGTVTRVRGTPSNLVVPSGATLGTVNNVQSDLYVLAINNAGTIELAVVNASGGVDLSETGVISTTAISAGATSASTVYSAASRSTVAYRVIGLIRSTQTTAGTWAASPTLVQGAGGNALDAMMSLGYGQTWQNVTGSRAASTTYYNTTGKPIVVAAFTNTASSGNLSLTINGVNANYSYCTGTTSSAGVTGIVPPGGSYSIAVGASTINTWSELR